MLKIKFGVVAGFGRSIEEVRDKQNRIPILASDGIEAMVVHTKSESTALLFDEEDRSSGRQATWANEAIFEIVVQKLLECVGLARAELIDTAEWWCFAVFKINLQIIRMMRRSSSASPSEKTSAKLWYSSGTLNFRSSSGVGILVSAARELVAAARSCKENWTAPGSLIARRKATVLIRAMSIEGGDGSMESGRSRGEVRDVP